MIKFFISQLNCNPNIAGRWGRSPLHCAAQEGQLDVVKYLIEEEKCPPICCDDKNVTPLHLSAKHGHLNVVEYLTHLPEGNSNRLTRCSNGSTALNQAALHGQFEIVQYFISELGCDKDIRGQWKRSLLHDAAQEGHIRIAKYLIEDLKFDPECLGNDKVTPIHLAAKYGHLDMVKYLIQQCPCNLDSSLLEAASYGDVEYISLSGYNGHPSTEDESGRIPLCYAAEEGELAVVKYLESLDCKQDLTIFYIISLRLAAKHGHLDTVKFFTEKPGTYWTFYCVPLHLAALNGHYEIVKHFVSDLKCCSDDQSFHNAIEGGHLSVVKLLMAAGNPSKEFDSNTSNYNNQVTPLHVATYYGYVDLVEYLTNEMHYDPLKMTSWGSNSLNIAAVNGHLEIIKFFSELNQDFVNAKDRWGRTPLYDATRKGHLNIVKYLIDVKKVKSTEVFDFKVSLLHLASGFGHLDVVKYLVEEKGCNVIYCDQFNNTPLHWAAHCGQLKVVEYFTEVRNCPGINTKGYDKKTPLEQAQNEGHAAVVDHLTLYCAKH